MQSFDSLSLHCRFYPGSCEATHGESLTLMPLVFLKLGVNAMASANWGVQACNQVIIERWRGGWSRMNVLSVGWRSLQQVEFWCEMSSSIKANHISSSVFWFFFYYYYYGLTQASVFFFSSVDFPAFIVRFTLGTLTLEESRRRTGRYRKLPEKRWKLMVHFDPLKERSIKQMDAFNTVFLKCLASLLKKQ